MADERPDDKKLKDEITWMKQLAEEGRNSPIAGGIVGIWWGLLSFVMMMVHWGVMTSRLPMPIQNVGWLWLAYVIVGSLGTYLLVRRMLGEPGADSMNSQIAGSTWMLASAGIFTFSLGSVIGMFGFGVPYWIFNAILPVALICYGIANGVAALLTGNLRSGLVSAASYALALVMFPFLLTSTIYLIAAFAILFIAVMSALSQGKTDK